MILNELPSIKKITISFFHFHIFVKFKIYLTAYSLKRLMKVEYWNVQEIVHAIKLSAASQPQKVLIMFNYVSIAKI